MSQQLPFTPKKMYIFITESRIRVPNLYSAAIGVAIDQDGFQQLLEERLPAANEVHETTAAVSHNGRSIVLIGLGTRRGTLDDFKIVADFVEAFDKYREQQQTDEGPTFFWQQKVYEGYEELYTGFVKSMPKV